MNYQRMGVANLMRWSAAALVTGAAPPALGGITDPALTVSATSSQGTATLAILLSQGTWAGDEWSYAARSAVELRDADSGELIAVIGDLACAMIADPQVTVNFTAVAGITDTTFSFSSGLLSYPSLANSVAFATVGTTVTDNDSNGATITGLYGGDAYRASYNGGTVFDTLLASYSAPIDDSLTASDRSPAAGSTLIGTTFDMQADWNFTLTANDQVGGTSLFRIVPAPGAATLLGLAGLIAGRRRR
ncbi:MAG: hypothetical protein IT436_17940 [Phycisphaerales bacterium]|nr:hypothetical protein [Phycisphaerales bacterium]